VTNKIQDPLSWLGEQRAVPADWRATSSSSLGECVFACVCVLVLSIEIEVIGDILFLRFLSGLLR
jgi:hypothetical protein